MDTSWPDLEADAGVTPKRRLSRTRGWVAQRRRAFGPWIDRTVERLATSASEQMAAVLADIRIAALWLASLNGVGAGLCLAWMISVYAEMYPGYASAGDDNCVLARAGAVQVKAAWSVGAFFLGNAVVALATVVVPYVKRVFNVVAAEWNGTSAAPVSRWAALATAFAQTVMLAFVAGLIFIQADGVLTAVRGETYITLMEARDQIQAECNTVRRQP